MLLLSEEKSLVDYMVDVIIQWVRITFIMGEN